ncbi:MAG: M20/M25/M40 family metallo-hydrolase [Ignavibacteria bacterium]|nr:M20/M25/M40 family metallo-hydrolase [Ignavibacteria bacterium]
MKKIIIVLLVFFAHNSFSQNIDSIIINKFFSEALSNNLAYDNLRYLCKNIGGRICGSTQSEYAVSWIKNLLDKLNLDTVFLQELMVRNWIRGDKEYAYISSQKFGKIEVNISSLGGSIGTGSNGLFGKVIEVKSYEELFEYDKDYITDKIIFFNQHLNPTYLNTFRAYGEVAKFRVAGAMNAAKLGATGVIIRSLTLSNDYYPHTGIMSYNDSIKKIPAVCISTNDADTLSTLLKLDKELKFYFRTNCYEGEEKTSYNVIGEIRGNKYPDKIILIGAHLDSWDTGEGAHDDGAGIVQCMEVLRLFKTLNISPNHTIRFCAFMDEEVAQRGGKKYAEIAKQKNEIHIAAIEADAGGTTPFGFSINADDIVFDKIKKWSDIFFQYNLFLIVKGGGGVDISFLKELNVPLIGLITDSQRYFDYHHSPNDRFENVHKRELQLGSASIAMLVYLIDKYDL